MSIGSIFRWIIRLIILVLVLILIHDNIQTVRFSLLGIYSPQLPLIVLALIFFGLGILVGIIAGFMKNLKLKSRIHQLEEAATTPKNSNNIKN